ncbi:hypothetical protein PFISCL1PPCAC_22357, partial [Pristionchus fissidentatus]
VICRMHTILLIQPTNKPESRTWSDYETTTECLEGICKIFEEFLKKQNPTMQSITYDVSHLFEFVDKLSDLSLLVFNKDTASYTPHNKEWIKDRIFQLLRSQAEKHQ